MSSTQSELEACGLCCKSTNRKKRKLLNGVACQIESSVLNKALLRHSVRRCFSDCLRKLKGSFNFTLYKCQKNLLKIKALEEELQVLIQQIDQNIETLVCRGSTELENSHQSLQVERPLQAIPGSTEAPSGTLSNSHTPVRGQRKRSTPSNVASIEGSPDVSVQIKRRNISKTTVITPRHKKAVVSLTTGRYKRAATNIVAFSRTHHYVLSALVKQMRIEMKTICSLSHNSILRSNHDAVKHFSWEIILREFMGQIPTVVAFLKQLLLKSSPKFLAF